MKILFVQYGNFAEAYIGFRAGAAETYRDQRYSVDYVASLAACHDVTTLVINETPFETVLEKNLRVIGTRLADLGSRKIESLLDRIAPDLVVIRTPHIAFLRRLRRRNIPTLPCFADIFANAGLRSALQNFVLRQVLRARAFPCVANHSLNASSSVVTCLRYPAHKTVPWDWTKLAVTDQAKTGPKAPHQLTAFYAGMLSVPKGVLDCLEAVAHAHAQGTDLRMSFAGPGDLGFWKTEAARLGISDKVNFLGMIPNRDVRRLMNDHDIVVVPSRHDYAEGLPNSIYEALASRSPLIISDHPAFRGRLEVGRQCLQFRAADPVMLADRMIRLGRDHDLYAALSDHSVAALDGLYVGLEWQALVDQFLADPRDVTGWVARNALTAIGRG